MAFQIREHVGAAPLDDRAEAGVVKMRDGIRLATDVYLPDRPTSHGVVLIRDPYDKASRYTAIAQMAEVFNDRGLAVVAQDCRGKFRSGGETLPYASDVEDAYDTIEWIVAQSWANGCVGLHGVSYLGYTAWAGVAAGHPAVKGAVPQGTGLDIANLHIASLWRQEVPTALGADDLVQIWTDREIRYVSIDYSIWPLTEAFEEAARNIGARSAGLDALLARSVTGEIPLPFGHRHPAFTTSIPVLHWSNWFDLGLGPMGMRDFRMFRRLGGRRDLHYLRAESADHGGVRLQDVPYAPGNDPWANDAEHAAVAHRQAADSAAFLAPLLGGRGAFPEPGRRVRWHTGHSGWRAAEDWPPSEARSQRWYLGAASAASRAQAHPDGAMLLTVPDADRATLSWEHDPGGPVVSPVTPDETWAFLSCYPDERDFGLQPGVVTFTSESVGHPLDICGAGKVCMAVGTTGPSMHLFVRLLDLHPDGMARLVTLGRVLLFRPDPDQLARVDLADQAYRLRAGHRLRLHVACSEHPVHLVHPGTDENPWFAQHYLTTRQTVVTGGVTPSYLELPVLPAGGEAP